MYGRTDGHIGVVYLPTFKASGLYIVCVCTYVHIVVHTYVLYVSKYVLASCCTVVLAMLYVAVVIVYVHTYTVLSILWTVRADCGRSLWTVDGVRMVDGVLCMQLSTWDSVWSRTSWPVFTQAVTVPAYCLLASANSLSGIITAVFFLNYYTRLGS